MVEEVNAIDKSKVVLSKIELGKSYTAKLTVDKYEFHVHVPTIEDDLQIAVKSRNLIKDLVATTNQDLVTLSLIYATLDSVTDKIFIVKANGEKEEIKKGFWDWLKSMRKSDKFLADVVFPVFLKFKEFENELDISEDELKNS
jgi:hypothetical protein